MYPTPCLAYIPVMQMPTGKDLPLHVRGGASANGASANGAGASHTVVLRVEQAEQVWLLPKQRMALPMPGFYVNICLTTGCLLAYFHVSQHCASAHVPAKPRALPCPLPAGVCV